MGPETIQTESAWVVQFLRDHPDFLLQHPELLGELDVVRTPGGAASLTSRQLTALREQNHDLRGRLRDMVAVARDNEALALAVYRLAQQVLTTTDLNALPEVLATGLAAGAAPHPLALVAFGSGQAHGVDPLWWRPTDAAEASTLATLLSADRPICGRFKQAQLSALFPGREALVGSAVVAPLAGHGWRGLLALGHADSRHYHPEMGVDLLAHLASLVTLRVDLNRGHHLVHTDR